MILLRAHDNQQNLTNTFVSMVKTTVKNGQFNKQIKQEIFLQGQEMGFCNDEIKVLIEDIIPAK